MQWFSNIDWFNLLYPQTPVLEIILRGTVMYLGLFLILRVVLKREAGTVGLTDLLLIVLIADAAQNGMADNYHSVTDGILLVLTLVFWAFAFDWLGYRFPAFHRFVHPKELLLVKNGKIMPQNMRKEFLTRDELEGMLREQGVSDLKEVKEAYLEGNGKISVITKDHAQHKEEEKRAV
jgi:uncharacterized membrane protein YcaP (DUF421 family)